MKRFQLFISVGVLIFLVFIFFRGCKIWEYTLTDKVDSHKYFWMFDSSKLNSITIEEAMGNTKYGKFRYLYRYENLFRYIIIEDAALNSINLNNIRVQSVIKDIGDTYIKTSEGNESMMPGKHIKITSELHTDSSSKLFTEFNSMSLITEKNSIHRLEINGKIKNILFNNQDNTPIYLFNFFKATNLNLIFYKPKNVLYIIVISPFEEMNYIQNAEKILKLD